MTDDLLVATTNTGKIQEIVTLLDGVGLRLRTLADLEPIEPPEETGATFAENARLKARYYALRTGLRTVAEDSGLEVDALGGRPGVESARFGGAETSYPEKFALLYRMLKETTGGFASPARFVCALTLVEGTAIVFEARGVVEGQIATAPRGTGGFGYDPIFYYPPFGCTLAEAGERKAEVSHRAQAFTALREFLRARPR